MRIPSSHRTDSGWKQFERMVLGGVPHALGIAAALSGSSLTVPAAPHFDAREVDLAFYGPIHQAYRHCVLARFLNAMESMRCHPVWHELKDSRAAQLIMVERCLEDDWRNQEALIARLQHWFLGAAEESPTSAEHGTVARIVFRSDARAA